MAAGNIWVERLIIVAVIAVASFFISGFVAQLTKKKGESADDANARQMSYQRAGLAGGAALGVLWMLMMAGSDHRASERRELLSRRGTLTGPAGEATAAAKALRELRQV